MAPQTPIPKSEASANFLDTIRTSIASRLATILGDEVNQAVYASIEPSRKGPHDRTLAIPKLRAVLKNANPTEIAAQYTPDDLIEAVVASGSFLSFHVRSSTMMRQVLEMIYSMSQSSERGYGTITLGNESSVGVGFEKDGSEELLEKDPILHLFNGYVAINNDVKAEETQGRYESRERAKDYFNRLEKGDPHLTAMWQCFRELSIFEYIKNYERLGVQFDIYAGESLIFAKSIKKVMDQLEKQGFLVGKTKDESRNATRDNNKGAAPKGEEGENEHEDTFGDGLALAIDSSSASLFYKNQARVYGNTIYMIRDIAGAIDRYHKYHFDKMLYVVGDQQNLHFSQCFKIFSSLEDCPFDASERLEHINFGRMKASPERFAAIEDPELTSDQIGMTAVKVQDKQAKRIMSYPFPLNRMTSFEGDTGPYLQCAHVRLCSVERKVALEVGLVISSLDSIATPLLLSPPKAREIVLYLATFPNVVRTALRPHEPSVLVTYCFKLAHLISSAWETIVVQGLLAGEKRK
ncbi:hypothetical protein M407DRAFT_31367 [Tulasnella calospora MUT 4182]|uniref:arginine--tRNA ligase n=1 Tax=Tulasnella calospora MUT 4182 TaxID=1051891 RepID=A0A0C3KBZ4_9AGAM|nr:hypothetical protein M407DRAFT_31367 [Tulasnella calospora MUT 4182]